MSTFRQLLPKTVIKHGFFFLGVSSASFPIPCSTPPTPAPPPPTWGCPLDVLGFLFLVETPVSEYPVLGVLAPFASEHDGSGSHDGALARSRGLCSVTTSRATSAPVAGRGGRGFPSHLRWTVYSVLQCRTHTASSPRQRPARLFLRAAVCLFSSGAEVSSWGLRSRTFHIVQSLLFCGRDHPPV